MRNHRSLQERNRDRVQAREQMRERLERLKNSRKPASALKHASAVPQDKASSPATAPDCDPQAARSLFTAPRLALAQGGANLHMQPWAIELAETLLRRTEDCRVSLRLLWPAEIDALAGLHAVVTLSRLQGRDLRGLRTLLYPGTHTSWASLDRITAERAALSELWRSTYETRPHRESPAMQAVLEACNEIEQYTNNTPPPQLRQLIPAFIYDLTTKRWAEPKHAPLERLIAKVTKLRRRELLRERIAPEWHNAARAPGALLVLPRGMKRKYLKEALAGISSAVDAPVNAVLIDGRAKSVMADPRALQRLSEFLKALFDANRSPIGTLVVTDDPTDYFVLRHRLEHSGIEVDSAIVAAECATNEWLASKKPKSIRWVPENRKPVNFTISILDKQAAHLAKRFGRIAEAVRDEGAEVEEPFRLAQGFVMRASHLPGGFIDLHSEESAEREYLSRDLEWERLEGSLRTLLLRGNALEQRKPIEEVIKRVHKHLVDCERATPLALKLKEQVQRFALDSHDGLTVLLSSRRNIAIAQRFLARELNEAWNVAKERIEWLTFVAAPAGLNARSAHKRLVIVGLSHRILRLIATHGEIPTGTCLLVPAQKAFGVTQTLSGMVAAETLKPYRARLSGLLTALQERLKALPDLAILARALSQLTVSTQQTISSTGPVDPKAYRFELEDGRSIQASGTIFRYEGVEAEEFKRVQARSIEPGDCIFEMSDSLRDEIEEAIGLEHNTIETSPARKATALYHDFVKSAVAERYPASSRQESIRAIQAQMHEIDPEMGEISPGKLTYWVSLDERDSAPHGARDPDEFLLFCRALHIDRELAVRFWDRIRRVRYENQIEGRQLKAIYAEILFSPESAQVYRNVSQTTIRALQSKALECVFHVVKVYPPEA